MDQPRKRSCKARLQELRKEFGISKKDYERAGREAFQLPSRDQMTTFIMASSEEDADRIAKERNITNYQPMLVKKPKQITPEKVNKARIKEEKKKNKRAWYFNNSWIDYDDRGEPIYRNVSPGDIIILKDEMNHLTKKQRYEIARIWLEDMMIRGYADKILKAFEDRKPIELVNFAVIQYYRVKEASLPSTKSMSFEEWVEQEVVRREKQEIIKREWPMGADPRAPGVPLVYIEDGEIPFFYEKLFKKYCKKHKNMDRKKRKQKFIKKMNKRYTKIHGSRDITRPIDIENDNLSEIVMQSEDPVAMASRVYAMIQKNADRIFAVEREMKKWITHNGEPFKSQSELEFEYEKEMERLHGSEKMRRRIEGIDQPDFSKRIKDTAKSALKHHTDAMLQVLADAGADRKDLKQIRRRCRDLW